ncbi:MAG: hypothetical protein ATN31_08605 [Candidatus Epulonipiscioides saccharophilum]|nr:MAG: hypothetical protein ATN31_08605 [Epulopiscium sp. AS2M-Bin001]
MDNQNQLQNHPQQESKKSISNNKVFRTSIIGIALFILVVFGSYLFLIKVGGIEFKSFADFIKFALIILGVKCIFAVFIYFYLIILKNKSHLNNNQSLCIKAVISIICTFLSIFISAYYTPGIILPLKGVVGLAIIIIIGELIQMFTPSFF